MSEKPNAARLRAMVETVLMCADETGDTQVIERLRQDVAAPGAEPILLLVDCALEAVRSRSRPVADSVRAWERLVRRARVHLDDRDPTAMSIRAMHAQYVRKRGRPGDVEEGIRLYREEWERRSALLGPHDAATARALVNFARAVRERGGDGDLAEALGILEEETRRRSAAHGGAHPFTWVAQIVLAQTQVLVAEADPDRREELALKALEVTDALESARALRFGRDHGATLNTTLVHAQALMLLDRHGEAVVELTESRERADGPGAAPGWLELLLGRALAPSDRVAALAEAREAVRLREFYYGADSDKAAEARALVAELTESGG